MKDENLTLFKKGQFLPINKDFMIEGTEILQQVQEVQEKYGKDDTDTFINELRDSITGHTLGFDLVNIEKHGLDCKMLNKEIYLEVKSASFIADSWQATFNDTTYEKAEAFKDKKVYLALAVWKDASDLLFICYGQNPQIGYYLEEKITSFKAGNSVRSTQSISISKLVFEYGFKILAVNRKKEEILIMLRLKNRIFNKMLDMNIKSLNEFSGL